MKRVLILIPCFLPGYKLGGPSRSIFNLINTLNDEFEFLILTSDRDLGDRYPYSSVSVNCWISDYGAKVRYCSPNELMPRSLTATIRDTPHDLLYLNSFFSSRFSVLPLVARRLGFLPSVPTVLAPRGEFSAGALSLKAIKKQVYMHAGAALGLFRSLHWHSSSKQEAADICAAMGVNNEQISIASNLSTVLSDMLPPHEPRAPESPLRVLFLSRISPMKNLDYALRILMDFDLPVIFTIAGPEEDAAYAKHCRQLANNLPDNIQVRWIGPVNPDSIPRIMASNDLFFLPTLGENFGHVIAEALGAGTPVLLSDTTPWRGLAESGIGHDLPLNQPHQFREALRHAWYQSATDSARIRARAASNARERQRSSADAEATRALFRAVLETASSERKQFKGAKK